VSQECISNFTTENHASFIPSIFKILDIFGIAFLEVLVYSSQIFESEINESIAAKVPVYSEIVDGHLPFDEVTWNVLANFILTIPFGLEVLLDD